MTELPAFNGETSFHVVFWRKCPSLKFSGQSLHWWEQVHVDSWGRDLGIGERKGKIVKLKYLVENLSWMTCGGALQPVGRIKSKKLYAPKSLFPLPQKLWNSCLLLLPPPPSAPTYRKPRHLFSLVIFFIYNVSLSSVSLFFSRILINLTLYGWVVQQPKYDGPSLNNFLAERRSCSSPERKGQPAQVHHYSLVQAQHLWH